MVKTICLLLGSFLILQAHGTSAQGGPLCDENEEQSDCYGHCQATCSVRIPRCTRNCSPGCVCQSGFIREFENGDCIRKETCPGCNGDPNAETGCDTCNTNCDNYDIEPKICSKRACRLDECKCIDGFVKNSKGLCIPYEECPPACGLNEEYSECNGHCQKTCENKNPICIKVCKPGCVCQPGYVKDGKTNQCIKEDQCPLSCGKNEVLSRCSGHCQKTCSVRNPKCPRICKQGCVCQYGFVRDDNTGKCVKEKTCPNIKCEVNEVPTKCLPGCPEDTCERAGKEKPVCNTLLPVPCKAGCICRENYFRNADGVCTSAADCLKCRAPNEVFGCRRPCDDKKCATLTKPCNILYRTCTKQCYCRKGYARNRCGQCIPTSKCPIRCPVNEEYKCVVPCPPKRCSTRLALIRCKGDQVCVNKCECKAGYLRNNKGRCVKRNQCIRCPANEEYKCVVPCPPQLCSTRFALIKCRGDQVCVNKCECKAGYLRNNKGRCVKRNQCEKPKCGKNEVFACHITCPPKTCMSMVARIICPKPNPCREQCDCKDNYLRNNNGICIPSKQCFPSLSEPTIDDATPPNETDETSEPDTGDAPPPADDDIDDDDEEYDD